MNRPETAKNGKGEITMKKLLALVLVLITLVSLTACGAPKETAGPEVTFTISIVDADGNETTQEITTSKATVGEALLEKGIVEGEDSEYGLYIKAVNGIVADYNTTGTYWAFYIDGEYALTGVEKTPIEEGVSYMLKVEKG